MEADEKEAARLGHIVPETTSNSFFASWRLQLKAFALASALPIRPDRLLIQRYAPIFYIGATKTLGLLPLFLDSSELSDAIRYKQCIISIPYFNLIPQSQYYCLYHSFLQQTLNIFPVLQIP